MSNVLLVATNYWPEPTGISVYTTDLAESLKNAGHSVSVLTSLPHYPWWQIPSKYAYLIEGVTQHNGIKVIRAKHLIPSKMNALIRIRFESSLWWNLSRISREFRAGDYDLVLGCIPTVAAGIVGNQIAKNLKVPFGLIVQDLSGAGAKQSGLFGGVIISKIAREVEGMVLRGANALIVVSPIMQNSIQSIGVPSAKITEIANYAAKPIISLDRKSARTNFGWALDDFIVLHSGNMGAKQDLVNVIRAAEKFKNSSKIKIYLVGHGNQESKLKSLCHDKKNIFVMPAVSEKDYSALLSAANLLLVNERVTQMDMSLPSKLTSYLFSRRPVLASVPPNGATWKFLDGIAELVEAGNPMALAMKIEELSESPNKIGRAHV